MDNSDQIKSVSVVGLGKMGSALAEGLVSHGLRVTVWNRTVSKCESLANAGATVANSVVEAAQQTNILVMCVSDYDASMEVLATGGMGEALKGKSVIQLTTLSPVQSRSLDEWYRGRDVSYLAGTILGYPSDVLQREAKFAFSGSRAVYDNNHVILDALTSRPIFINEQPGTAYVVDKVVYAQFYGIALAYLHAAAMAGAAGISIDAFRDIAGGDERWQWKGRTMDGFLEMAKQHDYSEAGCALHVHARAYEEVVGVASELRIQSDFPAIVARTMAQAIEQGHGEHELAAIYETFSAIG